MEIKQPKVSIIVPVYNVEPYLEQCLDSIAAQVYDNIEVIVVNDGSTDNSLQICKEYISKHEDWILIDQKNTGLSGARNAGVNVATGDYVAFIDSDDWIDEDFVTILVGAIEKLNVEIVESGIRWVYPAYTREEAFEEEDRLLMRDAMGAYLLQSKCIHSAVWNKLYKKSILDELRFVQGRLHEDGFFTYQAIYKCVQYGIIPYVGYNYRQNRDGSIMSTVPKAKNILDVTDMMEERIQFFKERNETDLAEKAEAYYYRTVLTNYVTALNVIQDMELAKMLKEKLQKQRREILRNKHLHSRRIKFWAFFYTPFIFRLKYMR